MIDDPEFRHLFQIESDEHLQALDAGLLQLEKVPDDTAILQEVFRAAHSLKGAARMMNLIDLERVAHELESLLGKSKRGELHLTSAIIDVLCIGVDTMRVLCKEAVSGESSSLDVDEVVERFKGKFETEAKAEEDVAPNSCEELQEIEVLPQNENSPPESQSVSQTEVITEETEDYSPKKETVIEKTQEQQNLVKKENPVQRIESIRVNTDKLDQLVAQTSELVVLRNHFSRRLSELETLAYTWSEYKKNLDSLKDHMQRNSLEQNGQQGVLETFYCFAQQFSELGSSLKDAETGAREDNARLGLLTHGLEEEIRSLRMLPFQNIFNFFPRLVRDLARSEQKDVELFIQGADTCADKTILEEIRDPLSHMIRNAIDHGIESKVERQASGKASVAKIYLRASQTASTVVIELEDDGRGLDAEKIKKKAIKNKLISEDEAQSLTEKQLFGLIFKPGFSTADIVTDISGRGVGMDVVCTNVEKLKGNIEIESKPGKGTLFRLLFPLTLATVRALIFRVTGERYALPVDMVERTIFVDKDSLKSLGATSAFTLHNEIIPIFHLHDLIGIPTAHNSQATPDSISGFPCIIIEQRGEKVGLIVEELESEQEIVLKPHAHVLERVKNVAGSTILDTGEICVVLNGADLIKTVMKRLYTLNKAVAVQSKQVAKKILLAEDSLTTRTQEKRILEAAGYKVVTAVDGAEAFEQLGNHEHNFDLLISDVEMPRMDGLSLASKVREISKYTELPIILVTSLASDEDKRRGSDAGANAYITKGSFNHQLLLDTIKRFL